jgi:hypothetical protein
LTKETRIKNITQNVDGEMQERIGKLCDFLAKVRTHIDRDMKGNMASIPEPELPTRLTKTLCKIVDAHSILYDRLPTFADESIAVRLILDNIPTERRRVLNVLSFFKEKKTTSEIAMLAKLPTPTTSRILNDLAALEVIERTDRETAGTQSDLWVLPEGEFKSAFLVSSHYEMLATDNERLRGVIRSGRYDDLYSYVYSFNNDINIIKNETIDEIDYQLSVETAFTMHLSELHPSFNPDAQEQQKRENTENLDLLQPKVKDFLKKHYDLN